MTRMLLAAAILATTACFNPIAPPDNRRDPGTVIVHVRDTNGAAIVGVWVYIELPNSVGSTFWEGTPTSQDGSVTHRVIPAGRRMLEVKPLVGFVADTLRQEIDVVKDRTTNAQFTLRRIQEAPRIQRPY